MRKDITYQSYSDEWYTDRDTVLKMLEVFPCKPNSTILLPFDSEKSEFVKVFKELGHRVIYGIGDFLEKNYEFDYIYTNPPFSIKDKVIERCIESGKECVLILPLDCMGG